MYCLFCLRYWDQKIHALGLEISSSFPDVLIKRIIISHQKKTLNYHICILQINDVYARAFSKVVQD